MPPVDLNLLPALDALLDEQSVTRAAARLHLSPAAMSRTLGRLRESVGDAILVRAGRTMVLTERARAMREPVRAALRDATATLTRSTPTPLAEISRTVTIRSSDIVVSSLVHDLAKSLEVNAPRVTLRFIGEGDEDVQALRDGTVDLDIGAMQRLGPEIRTQTLFRTTLVSAMRARHPLARGKLTAKRYASAAHVAVSRRGITKGPIDEALAALKLTRRVALAVPTFLLAAWLASESEYLTNLPLIVAPRLAKTLGLVLRPLPVPTPEVVLGQAWHPRFDTDPVHAWVRSEVQRLVLRYRRAGAF